jgi:hypothetical protein
MTNLPPEHDQPMPQQPDEPFENSEFAPDTGEESATFDEITVDTEESVEAFNLTPLPENIPDESSHQDENGEQTLEPTPNFEDLTLAELSGQFLRAPLATWQALSEVAQTMTPRVRPISTPTPATPVPSIPPRISFPALQRPKAAKEATPTTEAIIEEDDDPVVELTEAEKRREATTLGLRLTALIAAFWGNGILANAPTRTEELALNAGAPFIFLGFVLWLASEVYTSWPQIVAWGQKQQTPEVELPKKQIETPETYSGLASRAALVIGGLVFSIITWAFSSDNNFTTQGFYSWLVSIILWVAALKPDNWKPLSALRQAGAQFRRVSLRRNRILIALVLILLLGAFFRLNDLPSVPPEMTSDHVEKILDSQRVLQGTHQIFFANNGGRESIQMYLMALISQIPGLGMNFTTLKLLSAIEGLVAIVALWWFGREIVGEDNRRLGMIVGLLLAGLVAASYWHTTLSRLGLRIVLTTLITPIILVFLARAMRHNRREDYIKAGVALGFGLYMYQAVRMLPVVIVLGVALAFLFKARTMLQRRDYLINLAVLVLVSLVVFLPLFHYSLQYPEDFWRRTSGRLLGEAIQTTNDAGEIIERDPNLGERIQAFRENLPALMNNIRNALLMYNWKSDVAWINAAPNRPALDVLTASLFTVGLAAWIGRMFRRRDVVDWLIPLALFIMLLPSALAIAFPIENPSATRTSGSLPMAYLMAALPLGLILYAIPRIRRNGTGIAIVIGAIAIGVSYLANAPTYFTDYRESYVLSSLPYSQAGQVLEGFVDSGGAYGNAFMIAYPYWWDHRAMGMSAGLLDWPNGIFVDKIPQALYDGLLRSDRYRLDPTRDLLFFYAQTDEDSALTLKELFPEGYPQKIATAQPEDDFMIYRVPALGEAGFQKLLEDTRALPPIPAG